MRKEKKHISKGGFKGSEAWIEEEATSSVLLWGVIFQMAPNHIPKPVWKGQNIRVLSSKVVK